MKSMDHPNIIKLFETFEARVCLVGFGFGVVGTRRLRLLRVF